jgi:HEAT repeat protein
MSRALAWLLCGVAVTSCGAPPAARPPSTSARRDAPRSASLPTAFRRGVDHEVARWVALLRVPERAVEAVKTLERSGRPEAITPLCELYNDFASPLILRAIITLMKCDPGNKLGRAALVGSLRPEPDKYFLTILAADALGDLRATEAVLPLGAVLDRSFGVRARANLAKLAAIRSLIKIRDPRAAPFLTRAAGRSSDPPEVQKAAAEALRHLAAP